ncbi:MAG: alpha/beta hydrolase [Actinobacteria bacterium]|nr:alpha/beta hydrolase [Actinomycetota bacterium]
MGFTVDPEIQRATAGLVAELGAVEPAPVGDVAARRLSTAPWIERLLGSKPIPADVERSDLHCRSHDGEEPRLRWYRKRGDHPAPGPAALYIHGGGMILGTIEDYDGQVAGYVAETGVPMLSVDYRLAPEHPHPTPVEDCYAGLTWLHREAAGLGVDPDRIAVMGDSAGGGLAAATAILARERGGPAIASQILVYPMLDDRTVEPDPELEPFVLWSYDDNATGWGALLGAVAEAEVEASAAPARVEDPGGLPPTYLEVGELDIFRDEVVEFARRLGRAGVPTELHVHPGVPHDFELVAPAAPVSRRAVADRLRVLCSL